MSRIVDYLNALPFVDGHPSEARTTVTMYTSGGFAVRDVNPPPLIIGVDPGAPGGDQTVRVDVQDGKIVGSGNKSQRGVMAAAADLRSAALRGMRVRPSPLAQGHHAETCCILEIGVQQARPNISLSDTSGR